MKLATIIVGILLIAHVVIILSRLLVRLSRQFMNLPPFIDAMAAKLRNCAAYRRADNRKEDHLLFRMELWQELSQTVQLFPSIIIRAFPS